MKVWSADAGVEGDSRVAEASLGFLCLLVSRVQSLRRTATAADIWATWRARTKRRRRAEMFGNCLARTIEVDPDVAVVDDDNDGEKRVSDENVHVLGRHFSQRLDAETARNE